MMRKAKTVKPGRVRKIIKPIHPSLPENAEIEVHDAEHLYREIRIDNTLEDEQGDKVKLKEHADVDVVIEADPKATVPESEKSTSEALGPESPNREPRGTSQPSGSSIRPESRPG
jgi:hypothetical protein